jgi:hypothetical protein
MYILYTHVYVHTYQENIYTHTSGECNGARSGKHMYMGHVYMVYIPYIYHIHVYMCMGYMYMVYLWDIYIWYYYVYGIYVYGMYVCMGHIYQENATKLEVAAANRVASAGAGHQV